MPVELSPVIRRLLQSKLLPHEEQLALLSEAQKGNTVAMNRLVEANMRMVVRIALSFRRRARIEDLVQEGALGLMEAIRRFEPGRGLKLSTYAYFWIVMHCRKEARTAGGVVVASIRKPGKSNSRNRTALPQVTLDAPISQGSESTIEGSLRDETPLADEQLHAADRQRKVKARVRELFPDTLEGQRRRREILLRLENTGEGNRSDEEGTLEAIGNRLGISRERVRQIEKQMQQKMRQDPVMRKLAAQ